MALGRILLIDDEVHLRRNLQILLSRAGYTVVTAMDGTEGVQCLQRMRFDVVLTDLVMDGNDRLEILECLATYAPETPVIIITGYASAALANEACRRGAYACIAKPFQFEAIKNAIARALAKK
jgi:two-component system response regulator PilR (NtrC family)